MYNYKNSKSIKNVLPKSTNRNILLSDELNCDLTEFLKILNDNGSRISYFLDESNANNFLDARNIVGNNINLDSVSSNIILGTANLQTFFYNFGKKLSHPDINPYYDDCNPLNRYDECLNRLAVSTTIRKKKENYDDYNLKVFQTFITQVQTTLFADDMIDTRYVTRSGALYNPMLLIIDILKIDIKLFNILYLLNLHNSHKSPITGCNYKRPRTTVNENNVLVVSDIVTNNDIYNATIQMIDLIECVLKLVTFTDIDSYNKIIEDHFSITAIISLVADAGGSTINITPDNNIPSFLYGHLLSFCDAAFQTIRILPLTSIPGSPKYDPTKVANIAYNCMYGLLSVSQLMENFLKSRCFATIMAMLFPSGVSHNAPEIEIVPSMRDFGPRFKFDRYNDKDLQSLTMLAINGINFDMTRTVPPNSIPSYLPDENPIAINKALFCTIITSLCGISRFLWNSNAPCLNLCTEDDDGAFTPNTDYPAPEIRNITSPTVALENDPIANVQNLFSMKEYIQYIQTNTYASVITSNNKIFSFLQSYINTYAIQCMNTINGRINPEIQLNDRQLNTPTTQFLESSEPIKDSDTVLSDAPNASNVSNASLDNLFNYLTKNVKL